jgi:hypothetical protein
MDTRLAQHLLRRLRHQAEADAIERAAGAELLTEHRVPVAGRWVRTFEPGPLAAGRSQTEIGRMLERLARAGSISRDDSPDDQVSLPLDAQDASADQVDGSAGLEIGTAWHGNSKQLDAASLMKIVRRSADPLRAVDVATMLLLARSITMSATPLTEILKALRLPAPIITITGRVAGFEETFLDLLERGFILPGKVAACNGNALSREYGFRFSRVPGSRWRVVVFTETDIDAENRERVTRKVSFAAQSPHPLLGIAEAESQIPELLRQAAHINLICGPLDMDIVRKTMGAVLGETPEGGIPYDHASALTLADLALAIRPGTSAERALVILDDLARMRLAWAAEEEDDSGVSSRKDSSGKESGSTTASKSKSGRGNPGSGSERIEPAVLTGTDSDRFISRVETLSGYGEARDWALNLKQDLALWRTGTLPWEDMSAKLLLSGPPGTGKTTFARALCNTLQVPLIATSVATWMEPGYLGDVLIRMNAAFAEAKAAKPAILFVDEIDGINKRGSSGEWTTYWDQIVNRLLELLDGAARSNGVVVIGATNNPDRIDKALLRSGRLERHIVIPRPDTEALIGILRHHLKGDLDTVVATAPKRIEGRADAAAAAGCNEAHASDVAATGDRPATASRRNPPAE